MRRENNTRIDLTRRSHMADCRIDRLSGDISYYRCKGKNHFISARERWWFIAASNCESKEVRAKKKTREWGGRRGAKDGLGMKEYEKKEKRRNGGSKNEREKNEG